MTHITLCYTNLTDIAPSPQGKPWDGPRHLHPLLVSGLAFVAAALSNWYNGHLFGASLYLALALSSHQVRGGSLPGPP